MPTHNKANRLAHEKSQYLLQHAHNPVDWYPWGDEAFARASREGKLIFLSIGYSSCHWCHVMEREVFENPQVGAFLRGRFVSVKVDREERPDLDHFYMQAGSALSGGGGWPHNLLLTPERLPFFSCTYLPRETFVEIFSRAADMWQREPQSVAQAAAELMRHLEAREAARAPEAGHDALRERADTAYEALRRGYDARNGGFFAAPKFPTPHNLMFLRRYGALTGKPAAAAMARHALRSMADGGMRDQLGGGFFRYSTDARFVVPHFEKMLYDNALLALCCAEYGFHDVARDTVDFCLAHFLQPNGGFATAFDADSDGGEGAYYLWVPNEVLEVLGEADGDLFCRAYDITEGGNFEGKSIPNRLSSPLLTDAEEVRLAACREKLLERRAGRRAPFLDTKQVAGLQGLMIAALATAGMLLPDGLLLDRAAVTAAFALDHFTRGGRLHAVYSGELLPHRGTLDDYAYLAFGLLRLHQATLQPRWLEGAAALADQMIGLFSPEGGGPLQYTGRDVTDLPMNTAPIADSAIPSACGVAAEVLCSLSALLGSERFITSADAIVGAACGGAEHPVSVTSSLSAGLLARHAVLLTIRGDLGREALCRASALPHPLLLRIAEPADGPAEALICRDGACRAPITDPDELRGALMRDLESLG